MNFLFPEEVLREVKENLLNLLFPEEVLTEVKENLFNLQFPDFLKTRGGVKFAPPLLPRFSRILPGKTPSRQADLTARKSLTILLRSVSVLKGTISFWEAKKFSLQLLKTAFWKGAVNEKIVNWRKTVF